MTAMVCFKNSQLGLVFKIAISYVLVVSVPFIDTPIWFDEDTKFYCICYPVKS